MRDDDIEEPTPNDVNHGRSINVILDRLERQYGPSDPSFHGHSVIQRRGWAQPTLAGSNGAESPDAWHGDRQEDRTPPRRSADEQLVRGPDIAAINLWPD